MKEKSDVVKAEIRIGAGVVSIRRKGNSDVTTARVLGFEMAEDGVTASIWLDRLLHTLSESKIGEEGDPWGIDGAFVSVMSKRLSADELKALHMPVTANEAAGSERAKGECATAVKSTETMGV